MLTTDTSPSSKAVLEKDCSTSENVTITEDNVPNTATITTTTEPTRATNDDSESVVTKLNEQKRSPSICGDIDSDTSFAASHDLDQEYVDDNDDDEEEEEEEDDDDDEDDDQDVDLCDCSSDDPSEECCVGCTTTPTTLTHLSVYDDEDDDEGDEAETEEVEEEKLGDDDDDGNAIEPIETGDSETSDDSEDDSTGSVLADSQEDEDDDECGTVSSTEVSVNDSRIVIQKDHQKHGFNNNNGNVGGGRGGRYAKQTGGNNGNNQFKLNSRPFRPPGGGGGFNRQRFVPNATAQQQPQFNNNHNHLQQQQPQPQPMAQNTSHQRYMKLGNMMRGNNGASGGGVPGTNNNNNNNDGGNQQHYISNWGHRSNLVDKNGHIQRVTMELTNYIAIYKARYFYYFDLVNGRYPQFVRQFDNGMEIWRMSFNVYASGFMNLIAHLGEIHAFYQMEWVGQQLKWVYKDFNFYPNKMRYGFRVNSYDIADIYSRFIKFVCVKDNLLKSFPNVNINHKYYIKHKFEENLQAMKNRLNEVAAQIMVGSNTNANDGHHQSLPDSEDVQCGGGGTVSADHLVIDPDQMIGSGGINNQTQKPPSTTSSREQQQQPPQQGKNFIGPSASFNRIQHPQQQQLHRRFRNKNGGAGGGGNSSSSLTSSNKNGNNPDVFIRRGGGGNFSKQQQRGTSAGTNNGSNNNNNNNMAGGRLTTKY